MLSIERRRKKNTTNVVVSVEEEFKTKSFEGKTHVDLCNRHQNFFKANIIGMHNK